MAKYYEILYCPITHQYLGYLIQGGAVDTIVNDPRIAKAAFAYDAVPQLPLQNEAQYDYLYEPASQLVVAKPRIVIKDITPSEVVMANGTDFYTVTFGCIDASGNQITPPPTKNRDEAYVSELSQRTMTSAETTFKVRSRNPGTAKIRIFEQWDGKTLATGAAFLKYGMAYAELVFKVNSGW